VLGAVMIGFASFVFLPSALYSIFLGHVVGGLAVLVFLAGWTALIWRMTGLKVVANEHGLFVQNVRERRRIAWNDVAGFHVHGDGRSRSVETWLTNNESLTLMATMRRSREEVDRFVSALGSWLPPR